MVDSVEPTSFADDSHLVRGDVLVAINHKPITSVADVQRIQGTLKPGEAVQFDVLRKPRTGRGDWQRVFLGGTLPMK